MVTVINAYLKAITNSLHRTTQKKSRDNGYTPCAWGKLSE